MSKPEDSGSRGLLRSSSRLHQKRSLQEANAVSLQLSGNQLHQSTDPHGQVLRQLRQAMRLDPSSVATQACISLGQLYELETGGRRLFYSETLRHQAARRVARLLDSDWDAIVAGQVGVGPSAVTAAASAMTRGKVIPLHAPTAHGPGIGTPLQPARKATPPDGQDAGTGSQSEPPAGTLLLARADPQEPSSADRLRSEEKAQTPRSGPLPARLSKPTHRVLKALLGVLFGLTLLAAALRTGLFGTVQLPL